LKNIKKINLYGASGHAKVVIDCILSKENYEVDQLFDDNKSIQQLVGFSVSDTSELKSALQNDFIVSIGNNKIRSNIVQKLNPHYNFCNYISHKIACIASSVSIGKGSVVMPHAVINVATNIGDHCIINSSAVVEHDCIIEDFCHISPNATLAGGVLVGTGTHIGIGAQILPEIKIGKWATIGAGAVIIKDVPDGATVVGNPGKIIKR
tara:strand:- start:356 stop:979 length:624 start_codon:yes stop_codon:yes gene_type:complete